MSLEGCQSLGPLPALTSECWANASKPLQPTLSSTTAPTHRVSEIASTSPSDTLQPGSPAISLCDLLSGGCRCLLCLSCCYQTLTTMWLWTQPSYQALAVLILMKFSAQELINLKMNEVIYEADLLISRNQSLGKKIIMGN